MKSFFSLFFIGLLATGCATTPQISNTIPIYSLAASTEPETLRLQSYTANRIQSMHDDLASIGGQLYPPFTIRDYYEGAKASDALHLQSESIHAQTQSCLWPWLAPLAGAVICTYATAVVSPSYEEAPANLTTVGAAALAGVAVGELLGTILHFHFSHAANEKRLAAAELFNQTLLHRLHFEVAPQSGGGVGASLNY